MKLSKVKDQANPEEDKNIDKDQMYENLLNIVCNVHVQPIE